MSPPRRVLVLDGHSNQALACVRSLGRAGHDVFVSSYRRWPLAGWSRYSRGQHQLVSQDLAGYTELRAWAAAKGIQVVLPLLEGGCLVLNAERSAWERAGMAVACGPDELLQHAFDKTRTMQTAESCGVRIPRTHYPQSMSDARAAVDEIGLPCVVKPRTSEVLRDGRVHKSPGIGFITNAEEIEQVVVSRRHAGQWPLIQEFVPGHTAGAFALCDHGRAVAWFAHESLRDVRPLASPSCLRRSIAVSPRLREPAERLLQAMHWHGPAMVEFRDDGVSPPCLMEVNGRFWHSLELAVASGADFPRWWLRLLENQPIEESTDFRTGVVVRWLWGDVKRCLYTFRGPPAGYPGKHLTLWRGLRDTIGPQPPNTRLEMWQRDDPLPAIGEWLEGIRGVISNQMASRHDLNPALETP